MTTMQCRRETHRSGGRPSAIDHALALIASVVVTVTLTACGLDAEDERRSKPQGTVGLPGLEGVRSGEVEATLNVYGPARKEALRLRVGGTFLKAGQGTVPLIDMIAEADGESQGEEVDFMTALLVGPERAVLTYGGETYETSPKTFGLLESSFNQALGGGGAGDMTACLRVLSEVRAPQILKGPTERHRSTMIDGTKITSSEGKLGVAGVLETLQGLSRDAGCGAQLRAAGTLEAVLKEVEDRLRHGVKEARTSIAVDEAGLLREFSAHLVLETKHREASEVEFLFRLSQVNEVSELLPCWGERPLDALFRKLGFDPLEGFEAGEAEGLVGLLEGIYGIAA